MRNLEISIGEHYHLYSRGVNHENIFLDDSDRIRFMFLLLHQQSPSKVFNARKNVEAFQKYKSFLPYRKTLSKVNVERDAELVNFVLMGNHFHLTSKEIKEGGISKYMHRVLMAYSKYFNVKYKRTGHLFESRFHSVHVKSNEQLLHLSAYIHKNPKEVREWRGRECQYPWSSLSDYVGENRWDNLLRPDIVLGQFSSKEDYKKFIETSRAKELEARLGEEHFFEE